MSIVRLATIIHYNSNTKMIVTYTMYRMDDNIMAVLNK